MKTKFKNTTHSKVILSLSLLLLLTVFIQCNSGKKNEMSEYIEANIGYCMAPLIEKGVDSLQARSICKCTLEQLFKIEPKITKLTPKEWNELYNSNEEKILEACPELKKLHENAKK